MRSATTTPSLRPKHSRLRRWLGSVALPAWLLSAGIHALLFLAIAAVAGSAVVGDADEDYEVAEEVVVRLTPEPAGQAGDSAAPPTPLPAAPAKEDRQGQAPASDLETGRLLDEALQPPRPAVAGVESRAVLPAAELDAAVLPGPDLPRPELPRLAQTPIETEFFGSPARGTKFVYVIDRSASMQFGLGPAKQELLASLERLPPTAEFQVILYDLDARPLDFNGSHALMPATKENKARSARALSGIFSEGGTDHVKALKRALGLAPNVIYFLTDADELKPGQVQELTAMNQRGPKAVIHCIELSLDNANRQDNPMRRLARENQGEYRAVDLLRAR